MAGIGPLISGVLSFVITFLVGKKMIPFLHKLKYGQTILEIGPSWHKNKQGTPTMGGLMFILGIVISVLICVPIYYFSLNTQNSRFLETPFSIIKIIFGVIMALCYGAVGFLDDYIKVAKKRNLGLTSKQKLIFQFAIAMFYLLSVALYEFFQTGQVLGSVFIPFLGWFNFGIFYYMLSPIFIVGFVNAVNLTDGIDGLNSSITFFAGIVFMLISGLLGFVGFSIVSGALIGGCFGFLIYNMYPAKVFMGDTGSLFLGGFLCALAFGINLPIILILVGLVYILEMFSVMLQVIYFKLTHGKRLFKMSPIHHHFEMCEWSEMKICTVFSAATLFCGILAIIIVLASQ